MGPKSDFNPSSTGSTAGQATRFRIQLNPVEVTIFTAVTALFFYSVYHLFYEEQGFQPAALSASAPLSGASSSANSGSNRAPASIVAPLFANLEVDCSETVSQLATTAAKVRLAGKPCGGDPDDKWVNTHIVNTANSRTATVFTDTHAQKYSTAYLTLNAGKNPLKIQFVHRSGKIVEKRIEVTKN